VAGALVPADAGSTAAARRVTQRGSVNLCMHHATDPTFTQRRTPSECARHMRSRHAQHIAAAMSQVTDCCRKPWPWPSAATPR
jgi:hypothetical protein